MMIYARKLLRDLLAQKGQVIAVIAVTALGVMLYVSSAAAYRDLRNSYAATRTKLALARLHVDVDAARADDLAKVRAIPGVATADTRIIVEVPVTYGAAKTHAALRVLSLPDAGEPALDRVLVISGALPSGDDVLLEKHFARANQLDAGDAVVVGGRRVRVSGVAVSPEYLWVSRDANDFMPSPDQFGVGWMRSAVVRTLSDHVESQILVQPSASADVSHISDLARSALGASRVIAITKSEDLVGVKLMQMDVDGYREMAAFFPLFFLGVGAFIIGSALARLVDAQRAIIGTLCALGVGRGAILTHYLSFAMTLGFVGAVLGGVLGAFAAPALTQAYATDLNIPFVASPFHPDLVAEGLAMGLAISFVAGVFPALRAMKLLPAVAMRPAKPRVGGLVRVVRRVRMPLPVTLALRDILARPLRSFGTALGVSAAVVLVLSTGALIDSMKMTFSSLFDHARHYDERIDFAAPVETHETLSRARAVAGVRRAEAALVLPVTLTTSSGRADVLLQALDDDARLLRSVDANGDATPPGPRGITLTRAAAKKLHLAIGDDVHLAPIVGDAAAIDLRLTGFADAAMGNTASARTADVAHAWHLDDLTTTVLVQSDPGSAHRTWGDLVAAFPNALRIEDATRTRAQFDELMGLGWVMLLAMLAFGSVLAAAILFNTATLTILERRRELATLRALGLTMREITTALTIEHALVAAAGLAIGLPLAVGAAKLMLHSFASELFALPFVLSPATVALTLGGVFVIVLVAQWPALVRVARASLAESVRVRE